MKKEGSDEKKLSLFSEYAGAQFLEEIRGKRIQASKLVLEKQLKVQIDKKMRVDKLEEDVKRRERERQR